MSMPDSYFVDIDLKEDDLYPVYLGPEEGSPHNELIAYFVDEQSALDYCDYMNGLHSFEDADNEDVLDYEDLEDAS